MRLRFFAMVAYQGNFFSISADGYPVEVFVFRAEEVCYFFPFLVPANPVFIKPSVFAHEQSVFWAKGKVFAFGKGINNRNNLVGKFSSVYPAYFKYTVFFVFAFQDKDKFRSPPTCNRHGAAN